jgi:hypothetical protein
MAPTDAFRLAQARRAPVVQIDNHRGLRPVEWRLRGAA